MQKILTFEGLEKEQVLKDADGKRYQIQNISETLIWLSQPNNFEKGWRMFSLPELQNAGLDNLET